MDGSKTALERAFEIARSGNANNIDELKKTLASEGYPLSSLTGRTLTNQLLTLIKARQAMREADDT